MSAFVKNYYSPKNSAIFLAVSWETGYRDIEIRYNDRLVHTIPHPSVLKKGVKIQDEELGTLKLKFTTERPLKLIVKVNNKKFKTVNKLELGYDYSGLVAIFASLAVFAAIESLILGWLYNYTFAITPFTIMFTIGLLISVIYATCSILLKKKHDWAYFVGTGIFTVTTLISIIGVSFVLSNIANYSILVVRLGILAYLFLQMKHILKELRKSSTGKVEDGLLDG